MSDATALYLEHNCSRCGFGAHDVLGSYERTLMLSCVYCGLVESIKSPVAKPSSRIDSALGEEFRFQFGRFKGLTLGQTDSEPNGRRYLEWMAANNRALGDRIKEYLAQSA